MTDLNNDLRSTAEVAKLLGLKEGTIRAWLNRYPDAFQEGIHFTLDKGKRFWTNEGVERLRGKSVTQDVTENVTLQVTKPVALELNQPLQNETPDLSLIDSALEPMADQIAHKLVEDRLLVLVGRSLQRIIKTPTERDSELLAESLDRIGSSLGIIGTSRMLSGGLQDAVRMIQKARTEA